MKLFIKQAVSTLLFLLSIISSAQDNSAANLQQQQETDLKLQFNVGYLHAIAVGQNFLNDAYKMQYGVEVGTSLLINEKFLVGFNYDILRTKNQKPEQVGNITTTNIGTFFLNGGYHHRFNDSWSIEAIAGVGTAQYRNKLENNEVQFNDHAVAVFLKPQVNYNFTEHFAIYGGLKYRYDFMSIKTAPELEDYFSNSQMLIFSLGLKAVLF